MRDIYEEVCEAAGRYFDEGYNCAQAVALSIAGALNLKKGGIRELAAGFGHGMHAGCVCGAMTGGVMAISLLLAGPDTRGFDRNISEAVSELHRRFVLQFGQTCCRGLRKRYSPLKNARCRHITASTAVIAMEVLQTGKGLSLTPVGIHSF